MFLFPTGFSKPWETKDRIDQLLAAAGKAGLGALRFLVRAWLFIAIVGYALAFVAILIALTVAQNSGSDSRGRSSGNAGGAIGYVLMRLVADSLFWTFHPFSPFAYRGYGYYDEPMYARRPQRRSEPSTPFYEKVNRFVFGPTPPEEDPRAAEKAILAEIRAGKGRIGLADVMRVTGLPREEADPKMARLMLDYDGDVEVSEDGGITYRFPEIRKSAEEMPAHEPRPPAIWSKKETLPPLTGNDEGSNTIIALVNAFNLGMGAFALSSNLTLARLASMLVTHRDAYGYPVHLPPIPYDGVPIVLGVVPLAFSLLVFVVPIVRALLRGRKERAVAEENGRRAILREILTRIDQHEPVPADAIDRAWQQATGKPAESKEMSRRIVELGGDVETLESGQVRYRFVDLETEASALEAEREAASDEEAKVGRVIFGSDR